MKIAKDYSNVPTVYYRPEMENCLECGSRLRRSHRIWNKYIIQFAGTIYAVSMGYRCPSDDCSSDMIYRSAEAESLSLKYYSFGMDVIARVGELRFSMNRTLGEIHSELLESISISEREIQYLVETYMLLIAGAKQDKSYLDDVISPEGIILSIYPLMESSQRKEMKFCISCGMCLQEKCFMQRTFCPVMQNP